jgi:hypothetical protein
MKKKKKNKYLEINPTKDVKASAMKIINPWRKIGENMKMERPLMLMDQKN